MTYGQELAYKIKRKIQEGNILQADYQSLLKICFNTEKSYLTLETCNMSQLTHTFCSIMFSTHRNGKSAKFCVSIMITQIVVCKRTWSCDTVLSGNGLQFPYQSNGQISLSSVILELMIFPQLLKIFPDFYETAILLLVFFIIYFCTLFFVWPLDVSSKH